MEASRCTEHTTANQQGGPGEVNEDVMTNLKSLTGQLAEAKGNEFSLRLGKLYGWRLPQGVSENESDESDGKDH